MPQLGDLERRVMHVLWQQGSEPLSVREVLDRLTGRDLAYTTVLTVLDRLSKKQYVARELDGRAWRYTAAVTREGAVAAAIRQLLDDPLLDREQLRAELGPGWDSLSR